MTDLKKDRPFIHLTNDTIFNFSFHKEIEHHTIVSVPAKYGMTFLSPPKTEQK